MKDFMMIFRHPHSKVNTPSPETPQKLVEEWQRWIGGIVAQVKFISSHQLGQEGKIVKAGNSVSESPFSTLNEVVGGNLIVKAASLEEATEMAKGCPVLAMGGNVEIRNILAIS